MPIGSDRSVGHGGKVSQELNSNQVSEQQGNQRSAALLSGPAEFSSLLINACHHILTLCCIWRQKPRHISACVCGGGTELLLQCSAFSEFMTALSPPDCSWGCGGGGGLYWIILAHADVDIVPTPVYMPGKQLQPGAL